MDSEKDDPRQVDFESLLPREHPLKNEVDAGQPRAHVPFLLARDENGQVDGIHEGKNEVNGSHQNLVAGDIILFVDKPGTDKYEHAENDCPAQVVGRHRHDAPHLKVQRLAHVEAQEDEECDGRNGERHQEAEELLVDGVVRVLQLGHVLLVEYITANQANEDHRKPERHQEGIPDVALDAPHAVVLDVEHDNFAQDQHHQRVAQALDSAPAFRLDGARLLDLVAIELGQQLRIVVVAIVDILVYNIIFVRLSFTFEQILGLPGALRLFPRPQLPDVPEKLLIFVLAVLDILVLGGQQLAVTGVALEHLGVFLFLILTVLGIFVLVQARAPGSRGGQHFVVLKRAERSVPAHVLLALVRNRLRVIHHRFFLLLRRSDLVDFIREQKPRKLGVYQRHFCFLF